MICSRLRRIGRGNRKMPFGGGPAVRRVSSASEESRLRNRRCVDRIVLDNMIVNGVESDRPDNRFLLSVGALQGLCDLFDYAGEDKILAAAMSLDYIINFHPFVDGNKRTATMTALRILRSGGYRIDATQDELFEFVMWIAANQADRDEIELWLRNRVVSSPSASRRGRNTPSGSRGSSRSRPRATHPRWSWFRADCDGDSGSPPS